MGSDERGREHVGEIKMGEIGGIRFLHVGRVCLRSGGQIKPVGRGCRTEGTKTDLRWRLEVDLLASVLLGMVGRAAGEELQESL